MKKKSKVLLTVGAIAAVGYLWNDWVEYTKKVKRTEESMIKAFNDLKVKETKEDSDVMYVWKIGKYGNCEKDFERSVDGSTVTGYEIKLSKDAVVNWKKDMFIYLLFKDGVLIRKSKYFMDAVDFNK